MKPTKDEGDLWPAIVLRPGFKAPAAILREQAARLGERTDQMVLGEVKPLAPGKTSSRLGFAFNIIAPLLNNYRLRILTIAHDPTKVYPTFIIASLMPKQEDGNPKVIETKNESEFREKVKEIFADETTVLAIQSLWVQSEGTPAPSDDEIPF